jgi:hypothetical protein
MKKVKKQIPAYIPEQDANVLARARKMAYKLDYCLFTIFGLRFGWSSVVAFVPAIGDAADAALSLNLIRIMYKIEGGIPVGTLIFMLINIAIDFLVGLVPLIGDLADAAVKANGKNVRLLEEHLDKVHKPQELKDKEAKMPKEKRPRPASVYVDFDDEQARQISRDNSRDSSRDNRRDDRRGDRRDDSRSFDDDHSDIRQPQRAYNGRRISDEEMGYPQQSRRDERPSRNDTRRSRR